MKNAPLFNRGWQYVAVCACVINASCGTRSQPASEPRREAARELEPAAAALVRLRRAPWLASAQDCPADVVPQNEQSSADSFDSCKADLEGCVARCDAAQPDACYWGAVHIQQLKVDPLYSEALFLRACKLGVMSGCTNRAAGILTLEPRRPDAIVCAARTFEKTCAYDDAWGCTMLGMCLMRGVGMEQDFERALEVLPKGCRHGTDDPACTDALSLIDEIRAIQARPTMDL